MKTASPVAVPVKEKLCRRERIARELSRNKYLYMIAVPVVAYYALFCYLPMFGIIVSFKQYEIAKGIWGSKWVGLKNFKDFFSGIYFIRTLKNTLFISIGELIFGFPMPIIFALMLNELRGLRYKKFVQTTTYLPHFISMVVICGMVVDFFSTDGIASILISHLGGANMNYIGQPEYFRSIFIGSGIWQGVGWGSIIYLAALTGIDSQLYEAARIDGAKRMRQLWHITLPGIAPTIITLLILRMGQVMSVGYEKIILLYSTNTLEVADVISSYVYRSGIEGARYGYSAAVGMFQSIVNITLVFSANALSKKFSETSLF